MLRREKSGVYAEAIEDAPLGTMIGSRTVIAG
jgi:hypothetical protein